MKIKMKIMIIFMSISILVVIGCQNLSVAGNKIVQRTPTGLADKPYVQMAIYGTLTNFEIVSSEKDGEMIRLSINQELRDCKKNITSVELVSFFNRRHFYGKSVNLESGKKYYFVFDKEKVDSIWDGWLLAEGIQTCRDGHDEDLIVDQKIQSIEGVYNESVPQEQRVAGIVPTILSINQPTQISIDLINKKDMDIKFKILNLAIAEEGITQPDKAIIKECEIEYNSEEQAIKANSRITLDFSVMCKESELCQQYFEQENCDINGENCETAKLKHCERLYLAGQISYTDELGFEHIIPKKAKVLKQFIKIK